MEALRFQDSSHKSDSHLFFLEEEEQVEALLRLFFCGSRNSRPVTAAPSIADKHSAILLSGNCLSAGSTAYTEPNELRNGCSIRQIIVAAKLNQIIL
jgi:hypothetical protein